jgi:hypothetical protein
VLLVNEDPDSDVEFTIIQEQRPLDVFLNDESVVLDLVAAVALLFAG